MLGAAVVAAGAVTVGIAPRVRAAPTLPSPACAVRYPGYRGADSALPYAHYMQVRTAPAPQVVADAFAGPPLPPGAVPRFEDITRDLGPAGTSAVETGYGQGADGVVFVAVRTVMPRVTAAMWDWWFGWHSSEAARYKLWHPDAHRFAALDTDLTTADLTDRQKYIGNTTYVDEYVGPKLQQLGINFRDPVVHGFSVPSDQTIVFGRVGSSIAPVDLGWLAHQVRPIEGGAEMRSRFHLNLRGLHVPNVTQAACAVARGASVDPTDLQLSLELGRDLLLHCGQEMNHLAAFLPELHAEFS
ncbi:hypothetical protein HQ325_02070 [Rhodococcus sp. BP-349]|nr:hypothetical protein [Rhodococcus sp. BP-363]MBY6541785.1 hypothetical protein [Rhodococcus sp. BP-369]MBY6561015.1 hypothetical protein [Rhodococcus sp. BP-370]MBY6575307.1 hypothetical protein [Rhodococcus sp. BP-364]MBY6584608.1 hypothetical protein [Rhodococcus sp. BP-358]MBY6588945.1 hypothetical protein [Rhodococcus sp. BP-362]MBY6594522.1 hypothetical protein [Rhodococcus sp. BP-359]MBY6597621.1 hypothetical protein [Rhodococcus sp. BP-353]MBY6603199.1 hypothetical protein [Rhodoc